MVFLERLSAEKKRKRPRRKKATKETSRAWKEYATMQVGRCTSPMQVSLKGDIRYLNVVKRSFTAFIATAWLSNKECRNRQFTMVENRNKHSKKSHLIVHLPMSERVSE